MKTNFFKLAFMAFAATMLITSCSQNEEQDGTNQNTVLAVSTTIQDFTQDTKSRVIDEPVSGGYETKFETNDQIGVYAIAEDGTIMCKNMPMTYSAASKWESASPLYYYKNATYIAYSPYTAALSSVSVTEVADIKTYFTSTVFTDATKSYSECDLMTAEATTGATLPAANSSAITFNFSHAMSMVEFIIPVSNYKTAAGYEYSGPIFGVELKKKENAGTVVKIENMSALGKGVYRALLAPTESEFLFSGELLVGDGTQPVYFETTTKFIPTSGTYKKINVSYSGAPDPTDVVTRDIVVGDYYYSDGGIVPEDALVKPSKNLVGLVFSTTTSAEDQARGWNKGYVVALQGVDTNWGSYNSNNYPDVANDADLCRAFCENLNGYDETVALRTAKSDLSIITALGQFGIDYAITSDKSSGWYIPSVGQYIALFSYLGEKPNGYDSTNPTAIFANHGDRWAAFGNINTKLTAAGGIAFREFVWLSVDQDTNNGRAMQWKNGFSQLSARPKTGNHYWQLRPVLAF